jgi:hypothetical protein
MRSGALAPTGRAGARPSPRISSRSDETRERADRGGRLPLPRGDAGGKYAEDLVSRGGSPGPSSRAPELRGMRDSHPAMPSGEAGGADACALSALSRTRGVANKMRVKHRREVCVGRREPAERGWSPPIALTPGSPPLRLANGDARLLVSTVRCCLRPPFPSRPGAELWLLWTRATAYG